MKSPLKGMSLLDEVTFGSSLAMLKGHRGQEDKAEVDADIEVIMLKALLNCWTAISGEKRLGSTNWPLVLLGSGL